VDPQIAARLRREYESAGLAEEDMAADPFTQFSSWFDGVLESGLEEPNAFVVATADEAGRPSARAVLMKEFGEGGIVFYTGLRSQKSRDLLANPVAAATFVWIPLHRQVRIEGGVEPVEEAIASAYFASRPRGAQIAAHASSQSERVASRAALEESFEGISRRYGDGEVPRPEHWGGWRIVPETVEFWQGRPNRFHDRLRYSRDGEGWTIERLAP
jgi:pyridoxamine 5'-phosphate oxidase